MKLYERFADKGYHTSVATTFGIDFDAYENIALARLRGAGCRNNMVICDGRMLTHALGGASDLPQHAGTRYGICGAAVGGVYHPKLFLQFGRDRGRMMVGSANLTPSGLAGNLELVATITCNAADSGEQQLIRQAWDYVAGFMDEGRQSIADYRDRIQQRTRWLGTATPATGPVTLADGTLAALLASGETTGIAERFTALIEEPVHRLIVISPYWDLNLAALSDLSQRLSPAAIAVLVDPATLEFPKDAAGGIAGLTLYDRGTFREGRFIHAKAIIAQSAGADHILLGSANCTRAALGGPGFGGTNEEACLYRQLPPGSVLDALELRPVLTDEKIIQPGALDAPVHTDELPLDELGRKAPGQFECRGDTLFWHPPASADPAACSVTLLTQSGGPLPCTLMPLAGGTGTPLRYQISESGQRPAFARVSFPDGSVSPPAIVSWIDRLKMESRDPRSSGAQRKLDELEGDTEASLALLDVINELAELEEDRSTPKDPLSVPKSRTHEPDEVDANRYRVLSYQEFMAGRRPRTSGGEVSYNSLAGSDAALVRSILNRIVGLGGDADPRDDDHEDQTPGNLFDLGDETDNPEGDVAGGKDFGAPPEQPTGEEPPQEESEEEKRQRRAQRRRATQEQLVGAIEKFQKRMRAQRDEGSPLTNYDLLRLRALLMVLSTAASPHPMGPKSANEERSLLRVLPVEGDAHSWPNVMGRLLFTMFGSNKPVIRLLHLKDEHDQIPGDFNECWATCYWCFQACLQARLSYNERKRINPFLRPMAGTAFLLTLPSKEELLSEEITGFMDRMSKKYAKGLCLDPAAIRDGHRHLVKETFREGSS